MSNTACHRNNTRITFAILDTEGRELHTLTEVTNTSRLMRGAGLRVAMYNALDVYADRTCPGADADDYEREAWEAEAQGSIVVRSTNRAKVSAALVGQSAQVLDVFPGMDDAKGLRFYA